MTEIINYTDEIVIPENKLSVYNYFVSSVYIIKKPEFLDSVRLVSLDKINSQSEENRGYGICHTDNLLDDERITEFSNYIAATGWNILNEQGYYMEYKQVFFESMWCQEYKKNAHMPQHVHPNNGAQLIGFYFIDTPTNCPKAIIHDPRSGKVQINMQEANSNDATNASDMINFQPEPGLLLITNAWLPHSFTQNLSKKSFTFVHFNMSVRDAPAICNTTDVEII